MKIVMIVSHPDLNDSIANKTIIDQVKDQIENLEIRHIESLYPNLKIDVEKEQKALLGADIIIFQHPFYWYSTPAGLKQWMDDVLSYGFAFGHDGDKLKGKHFIQSLTIGGPEESYKATGFNHFTIQELLRPMEQTVYLTKMVHHGFVHTHRNSYIAGAYNSRREVELTGKEHSKKLIKAINEIKAGDGQQIKTFIEKWVSGITEFDENSFFTQYLDPNIIMNILDYNTIKNKSEFNTWYDYIKGKIKVPVEYNLSNLKIKPSDDKNHYVVDFVLKLNLILNPENSTLIINLMHGLLLEWDSISKRPNIKEYYVWSDKNEA